MLERSPSGRAVIATEAIEPLDGHRRMMRPASDRFLMEMRQIF